MVNQLYMVIVNPSNWAFIGLKWFTTMCLPKGASQQSSIYNNSCNKIFEIIKLKLRQWPNLSEQLQNFTAKIEVIMGHFYMKTSNMKVSHTYFDSFIILFIIYMI